MSGSEAAKTISDSQNILRYCLGKRTDGGRPIPAAFRLRAGETYLSANWIGYFCAEPRDSALLKIRVDLEATFLSGKLGTTAVLAELNAGRIRSEVAAAISNAVEIDVIHYPERVNPSHSGITGVALLQEEKQLEVASLLCELVELTHPT